MFKYFQLCYEYKLNIWNSSLKMLKIQYYIHRWDQKQLYAYHNQFCKRRVCSR